MSVAKKAIAGVVGAMLVAFVGWKAFEVPLSYVLIDRMLDRAMTSDVMAELPDGLHVGLCGSSGPLPSADRAAGCAFVIAGKDLYVIDAGSGSAENFALMGLPTSQIRAVFLTHFHSHHIDGLGELMMNRWVQGHNIVPLRVYGTRGVEHIVAGLRQAYALDASYRTAHHGEDIAPSTGSGGEARPFEFAPGLREAQVILDHGDLTVSAFRVDHEPIEVAIGYRFDYKGRSVVITGDTVSSRLVVAAAQNTDVLVHEAMQMEVMALMVARAQANNMPGRARILLDASQVHTSPKEAARVAAEAGASYLLLTHIVPALPAFMDKFFLGNADDAFEGPITIGRDGFMLSLPAGSDEIIERELL
jgi:ribonuclease Z